MHRLWFDLLANLAVVVLFVSIWLHLQDWIAPRHRWLRSAAFGTVMAAGTLALLQIPFEVQAGVYVDLRTSLIAVSGFFGGPIAGAITGLAAAIYRIYMGGTGVWSGLFAIGIAAAVGIAGYLLLKGKSPRPMHVVFFSGAVAGAVVLSFAVLATFIGSTAVLPVALPVAALTLLATLVAALAIYRDNGRRAALEANVMYRAIIEALPDSLNAKDLQGRFLAVNPATAKLMQAKTPDQLIGKTDADFYPAEVARRYKEDEERALAAAKPTTIEQRYDHADGTGGWLWTLKTPFRDSSGEIVGLVTHNRDITDWKRLEEELAASRRHLSEALTHMADALVMYDRDDRIIFSNAQFRALFPLAADAWVPGAHLHDILDAAAKRAETGSATDTVTQWIGCLRTYHRKRGSQHIRLDDGRWLDARGRKLDDGGFLVIYSDITQTKQAEETLVEINTKLEATARTDGLTGLLNRRAFDECLSREFIGAQLTSSSASLLMIDVDRFKAYNDIYGHPAGDECLRAVGRCLRETLARANDLSFRYGGEEMAAILPDTDADGAFRVAEHLRNAVRDLNIPHDGSEKGRITVSIGIATVQPGSALKQPLELVRQADEALYGAKASGRDRARSWRPHVEQIDSRWRA